MTATVETGPGPTPSEAQARRGGSRVGLRVVIGRLSADRGALVAVVVLLAVACSAALASQLAPYSPTQGDVAMRLRPPLSQGPNGGMYLLGTDPLGRDVLSRVIHGARVSLVIGCVTVVISVALGFALGTLAGYVGGWLGDAIMRLVDIQLAFPFILLAIAVVAVLGPGLQTIIFVLGVAGWVIPARIVRAEVLSLCERDFVLAARGLGATQWRILSRHIARNTLPQVIVIASFAVAQMIIVESALSFVGLGVPPPTPSWGSMLADGQNYLTTAWWVTTAPGMALMLTILSINLVGDFLRDALDPHLQA